MNDSIDITPLLDPEIATALTRLKMGFDTLSRESLPKVREFMANIPPLPLTDNVERTDNQVPDRPEVSVRVHRPKNATGKLPCIYWMHGGGLVIGSNSGDDLRFDRWCMELNCMGASVEYGLAPESPYPGPLEDCYAGLRWLHENADELDINADCVGIGGSSAGAGLAAGLGLLVRDRGEFAVAFQALIYPMIDDRQITTSSQWNDPVWPPQANRFGWDSYLGGLSGDNVPYYAAAARATDLRGLAPTFICVGALDGFADEDVEFATRLRHAGVASELHVYPGAPHGFDALMPNTSVAKRAKQEMEVWLRSQLGR